MATPVLAPQRHKSAGESGEAESRYEVIDGRRVESHRKGARESFVANMLSRELWLAPGVRDRGVVLVEVLFQLADNLKLRPDLAFVPFDRWTSPCVPDGEVWPVVPALAVEVVSKSSTAHEVQRKIHHYFGTGVDLVWVVYPQEQQVYAYRGPKDVQILDGADELDGDRVVPGFQLPVHRLFERLASAADASAAEP